MICHGVLNYELQLRRKMSLTQVGIKPAIGKQLAWYLIHSAEYLIHPAEYLIHPAENCERCNQVY